MSQTIIAPHDRTMRLYGCGGGGINLVRSHIENSRLVRDKRRATELYSLIDTSLSNLHDASAEYTYTLKGVDGSGGDPAANALRIKKQLPDIMEAHPPADMNIVIFSNGGGTGSAAAPIIINHLLDTKQSVIAVMIGMTEAEALKTVRNCLATVKGLEQAVQRHERPLVVYYAPLDPTRSMSDNNVAPLFALDAISILCSGHNPRLDKADIDNFIDYPRVTLQDPALSLLRINCDADNLLKQGKVTSYLALMENDDLPAPRVQADYAKHGLLAAETGQERNFFYTVTANLGPVYDDLSKMQKMVDTRRGARVEKTLLSDDKVKVDEETGLVFD